MTNLEMVLNQLEQEANSGANYELSSYEQNLADDYEDFLQKKMGYSRNRAAQIGAMAAKRPQIGGMIKQIAAEGGVGLGKIGGTPTSAAQTVITASRASRNIPLALPVPLFGAIDAEANFVRTLSGFLPAGVAVSAAYGQNNARPNDLQLTYTQGANVDIITVTCSTIAYPTFLASLQTDYFRVSRLRYSLSAAQFTQYEQSHSIVKISMFGNNSNTSIEPSNYFDPKQFQSQVIDLPTVFDVDKETGLVFNMLDVAGFSVSMTLFIDKFYRQNAKGF